MPDTNPPLGMPQPAVSVVVPVRNEVDNVRPLTDEIAAVLHGRWSFELIFVNDGSTDGTEAALAKLKADIAKALLSLPAVMGFEYGAGFGVATLRGSQNNDAFINRAGRIGTETNRHGGMLGGISSGEPIVCRVALKPTSSLPQPQRTVTTAGEPTEIVTKGRHDPCLLPRFVPMGEAMLALVLVDHWLRFRAQCGPPLAG